MLVHPAADMPPPPFTQEQEARIRAILVEVLADHPTIARAIWPTIELLADESLALNLRSIGGLPSGKTPPDTDTIDT